MDFMPQPTDHFHRLLPDLASRAASYLDGAQTRRVAPPAEAVEALSQLDTAFPDEPLSAADLVDLLDRAASPATVINTGGRFFGFVNGGTLPGGSPPVGSSTPGIRTPACHCRRPAAHAEVALRRTRSRAPGEAGAASSRGPRQLLRYPFRPPRPARPPRLDVERDGLFGAPRIDVVVGDEVHASVLKALSLAGLGRERVHRVPVDDQGRVRPSELPPLTTNTLVLSRPQRQHRIFRSRRRNLRPRQDRRRLGPCRWRLRIVGRGFTEVPSFDERLRSGRLLGDRWPQVAERRLRLRRRSGQDLQHLRAAMSASASYLVTSVQRDPMSYAPDMSRRARGIEFWATLRSLGRTGLAALIERTCSHAQRFAAGLRAAGFEILNDVVINQVMVSFGTPERTLEVIKRIQDEGTCWAGSTVWQGRTAMRISVSSWATTEEDVDQSLAAMLAAALS